MMPRCVVALAIFAYELTQAMIVMAIEGAIVMAILGVLWWRAPAPDG